MLPQLCQFYGIGPEQVRASRFDEYAALVNHMNDTKKAEKAELDRLKARAHG